MTIHGQKINAEGTVLISSSHAQQCHEQADRRYATASECLPGEASLALHAMAVSSPPPRARPETAATDGFLPASRSSRKLSFMLQCKGGSQIWSQKMAARAQMQD